MLNDGPQDPPGSGPARPGARHRLTRSITESASIPSLGKLRFAQFGNSIGINSSSSSNPGAQQPSPSRFSNRDRLETRESLANMAGRASLDLARSRGVSPNSRTPSRTPSHSRQASLLVGSVTDDARTLPSPLSHSVSRGQNPSKATDAREKEMARQRLAELKRSFYELSSYLTTTNQRIYDTYYSVMERTLAVEASLATLSELGQLWRNMNDGFDRDAASITSEAQSQLDALGNFDTQRKRIRALQARIQTGRVRVTELGGRVETVRRKVERWERRDAEWQDRTRRRLKVIWILVLVAGLLVVLLVVGAQYYQGPSLGERLGGDSEARVQMRLRKEEDRKAAASRILGMLDEL